MEKAKIGVSVGLLGAIMFFMGTINILGAIVIAGYVLLKEENQWLKKAAVKMLIVVATFGVLLAGMGLVNDVVDVINVMINWFTYKNIDLPLGIDKIYRYVCYFGQDALLLLLGFKALSMGTIKLGFFDKIINKHM